MCQSHLFSGRLRVSNVFQYYTLKTGLIVPVYLLPVKSYGQYKHGKA
jgi:hypothetical protein